jgi:type IV pilus assembly protein PilE
MNTAPLRKAVPPRFCGACDPASAIRVTIGRRTRGFTLVEVLITVATVSILASVALPAYTDYVTRSKLTEATSSLSDMRVRLEQYYQDTRTYPTSCIAPAAGPPPAGKVYLPSGAKYFTVTCALTATTYTVTAAGNPGQGVDAFAYTIDQANNRKTTSLPSGWSGVGPTSTCWINRKNGDC